MRSSSGTSSAGLIGGILSCSSRMGSIVVTTSNKVSDDLYRNGVQRRRLKSCVDALSVPLSNYSQMGNMGCSKLAQLLTPHGTECEQILAVGTISLMASWCASRNASDASSNALCAGCLVPLLGLFCLFSYSKGLIIFLLHCYSELVSCHHSFIPECIVSLHGQIQFVPLHQLSTVRQLHGL